MLRPCNIVIVYENFEDCKKDYFQTYSDTDAFIVCGCHDDGQLANSAIIRGNGNKLSFFLLWHSSLTFTTVCSLLSLYKVSFHTRLMHTRSAKSGSRETETLSGLQFKSNHTTSLQLKSTIKQTSPKPIMLRGPRSSLYIGELFFYALISRILMHEFM